MNELLHKFKLGNDAELLLEKRGGGYEKVATVPIGSQALGVTQSAHGIAKITAGDASPPVAAMIGADSRERKRLLSWGHSISEQCLPNTSTLTTSSTAAVSKGSVVIPVTNGAALTANDVVAIRLYNGHYWHTTVASVASNNVTIADKLPAYIKLGASLTKVSAPLTQAAMISSYGCGNAAVALLGGCVEVVYGYGYGGATQLQMIIDFERYLRYYRPDYCLIHMYENDLADGNTPGGSTLEMMQERTRWMCRMAQSYGAVPIVVTSGPYYKAGPIGVTGQRILDYDAIATWVMNVLPLEAPGAHGVDISTQYTDPAYLNDAYGRRPLPGYTDGVHLNNNKRFFAGQIVAPQIKDLLPPAEPLVGYALSDRYLTTLTGTGGTATNLAGGSVVPAGYTGVAAGTAVVTISKNADGSTRIVAEWPAAASNSADTFMLSYLFGAIPPSYNLSTVPPSWPGTTRAMTGYARIKIRESAGVASVAPVIEFRPSYNKYDGTQSIDMLDSMPVGDGMICLTTPQFTIPEATVRLDVQLLIKPKAAASPANGRIVVDVYELGVLPVHPQIPVDFV